MTTETMIAIYIINIIAGMRFLIKGLNEFKLAYYLIGGTLMIVGSMGLGYKVYEYTNENDMKKSYKFNTLEQMRFDDYGFGLFVIGNELCFKSADGKTYTVGSGNEISVCDDAKVKPLEE